MKGFETKSISPTPDAIAPDGSAVRVLAQISRGSMAHFSLEAGKVSRAVAHRTIEELWFFTSGHGRMWRRFADREEIVALRPGVSLSIPTGTAFQFRNDGNEPLQAVGVAMPPWPGPDEAFPVDGIWPASV